MVKKHPIWSPCFWSYSRLTVSPQIKEEAPEVILISRRIFWVKYEDVSDDDAKVEEGDQFHHQNIFEQIVQTTPCYS